MVARVDRKLQHASWDITKKVPQPPFGIDLCFNQRGKINQDSFGPIPTPKPFFIKVSWISDRCLAQPGADLLMTRSTGRTVPVPVIWKLAAAHCTAALALQPEIL